MFVTGKDEMIKELKRSYEKTTERSTQIGYIKADVDDIKRKQDGQEDKHNQLCERVTRIEESTKQAHLRINRLEGEKHE